MRSGNHIIEMAAHGYNSERKMSGSCQSQTLLGQTQPSVEEQKGDFFPWKSALLGRDPI